MKGNIGSIAVFSLFMTANALATTTTSQQLCNIAPVWSGHPVKFTLLSHESKQFVAFYDAERKMTIAARLLPACDWQFVKLPETLNWDSHNDVVMAIDNDRHLHVSGNMHNHPLTYFRTKTPLDITSFERVNTMTGRLEERVTYPKFFRGPANEFIFTYRDGSSGNGNQLYNVYDHATRTWKPLLDTPLTDGLGQMNAYLHGPVRGPDGFMHLVWVWRETKDCETNRDLSYARSRDMRNWETSTGSAVMLPMTPFNCEIVDPVQPGQGLINGNAVLGFDSQKRPVISYHKYDAAGKSQVWNARLENGAWRIVQASDWDYRWHFGGPGTINFEIAVGPVRPAPATGRLIQNITHPHHSGSWLVDEESLKFIERADVTQPDDTEARNIGAKTAPDALRILPRQLQEPQSDFPEMGVRIATDSGRTNEPGTRYVLRWETLGTNRDRPRTPPLPAPSMLQVIKITNPGKMMGSH